MNNEWMCARIYVCVCVGVCVCVCVCLCCVVSFFWMFQFQITLWWIWIHFHTCCIYRAIVVFHYGILFTFFPSLWYHNSQSDEAMAPTKVCVCIAVYVSLLCVCYINALPLPSTRSHTYNDKLLVLNSRVRSRSRSRSRADPEPYYEEYSLPDGNSAISKDCSSKMSSAALSLNIPTSEQTELTEQSADAKNAPVRFTSLTETQRSTTTPTAENDSPSLRTYMQECFPKRKMQS